MWHEKMFAKEMEEGFNEGYQNGGHIANRRIAINLLECGIALEQVSKITGLTREKVFELQNRIRRKS